MTHPAVVTRSAGKVNPRRLLILRPVSAQHSSLDSVSTAFGATTPLATLPERAVMAVRQRQSLGPACTRSHRPGPPATSAPASSFAPAPPSTPRTSSSRTTAEAALRPAGSAACGACSGAWAGALCWRKIEVRSESSECRFTSSQHESDRYVWEKEKQDIAALHEDDPVEMHEVYLVL